MNPRIKAAAATCLHRSGVLALLQRFQPAHRGLVLMFHRVLPRADKQLCYDPHLVMAEDVFAALLELLARDFRVLPLAELAAGSYAPGKPPVAITFDDAWEDTYSVACPLLHRHNFSATIFLCPQLTSNAEKGAMLPEERFARIWGHADAVGRKRVAKSVTNSARAAVTEGRKGLSQALKQVPMDERLQLLAGLELDLHTPAPPRRSLMTWDETRSALHDGFTLGSHTLRHCTLTSENDSVVRHELLQSREEIFAQTGVRPGFFAYPNGALNPQVEELVRTSGYSHGFSTAAGYFAANSRAWAVPRLPMEDEVVSGAKARFHQSRARTYLQLLK